jgi:hypothetical protein
MGGFLYMNHFKKVVSTGHSSKSQMLHSNPKFAPPLQLPSSDAQTETDIDNLGLFQQG